MSLSNKVQEADKARDALLGLYLGEYMAPHLWDKACGDTLEFWFLLPAEHKTQLYDRLRNQKLDPMYEHYRVPWETHEGFEQAVRPLRYLVQELGKDLQETLSNVFPVTQGWTRQEALNGVWREGEPIGDHFCRKVWQAEATSEDSWVKLPGWTRLSIMNPDQGRRRMLLRWAAGQVCDH